MHIYNWIFVLFTKYLVRVSALTLSSAVRTLIISKPSAYCKVGRLRLKCDGTRAETRFRLSTKRTSPFKSAGASVQSTAGRRVVHISLQGLYCSCKPVFCSHVTLTGYPLHSLVAPSLLLPCVTVCNHISTGRYIGWVTEHEIYRMWGVFLGSCIQLLKQYCL